MALAARRQTDIKRPKVRPAAREQTRQAVKSAETRARLIAATIRTLVKVGYAKTTALLVAQEAGLSRGAMLHHFDNGPALIKATIIDMHERRLRALQRGAEIENHDPRTMLRVTWNQFQKPTYIAFHELETAARTNPELAEMLLPLRADFLKLYNEQAAKLYPEWRNNPERLFFAMTLTLTLLEGMAVRAMTGALEPAEAEQLLQVLEDQIRDMRGSAS